MSKSFECVIADHIHSAAKCDQYQFGFKTNHSTAMCTSVLSKLSIIIGTEAAMCSRVL